MSPATVHIAGDGLRLVATETHPAGRLFSGGYDAASNALFLASVMGHPRGVSLAGGEPSDDSVSGLRVLIAENSTVYWMTDSMSLPRGLNESESESVQASLENHFRGQPILRVEKLEDIPAL
jgi:hypothetical protein